MVENRWQIVIGAVILLLMLLAGAFSLGVYVGEHGWTREGLTYQPDSGVAAQAGQVQPQGQLPAQGQPQGQAAGTPLLTGRILNISIHAIELATQDGRRRVEIDEATIYRELNGPDLLLKDLSPGDIVAIHGEMIAGDGGRLLAHVVVRLPIDPPAAP
jgi:hypothetical protein